MDKMWVNFMSVATIKAGQRMPAMFCMTGSSANLDYLFMRKPAGYATSLAFIECRLSAVNVSLYLVLKSGVLVALGWDLRCLAARDAMALELHPDKP
ncbi:MAG TPA: hypothetical protein VIC08_14170 [Cellvibrionaceae bacterium]